VCNCVGGLSGRKQKHSLVVNLDCEIRVFNDGTLLF